MLRNRGCLIAVVIGVLLVVVFTTGLDLYTDLRRRREFCQDLTGPSEPGRGPKFYSE